MSVALDPGAWNIRSLRRQGDALVGRRQRSAWLSIPDTRAERSRLDEASIPFAACQGSLVLMGDAARDWSHSRRMPVNDLLPGGMIPSRDPVPRQIVQSLVDAVVPPATYDRETCAIVQPAQAIHAGDERADGVEFFRRLLRVRGYETLAVSAGLALAHAELVREEFTGLALVWGASGCEVCVARHGVALVDSSVPRGGRWLDDRLAQACEMIHHDPTGWVGFDLDQAARLRESATGALVSPSIRAEEWIQRFAHELVQHTVAEIARILERTTGLAEIRQPLAVICGGGLFEMPGLLAVLSDRFQQTKWPIRLRVPRRARHTPFAIARGALIVAELEENARRFRAAA
jgi:hypothetical protein